MMAIARGIIDMRLGLYRLHPYVSSSETLGQQPANLQRFVLDGASPRTPAEDENFLRLIKGSRQAHLHQPHQASSPHPQMMASQDVVPLNIKESATNSTLDPPKASLSSPSSCQTRWSTNEILVLIAAKGAEHEKNMLLQPTDRMQSRELRWQEVEKYVASQGIVRGQGQCRKRWERLMNDFRKVHDYQSKSPKGPPCGGYFEMMVADRKRCNLPHAFLREWYDAMVFWLPRGHQRATATATAVRPQEDQAVDSSTFDDEEVPVASMQDNSPKTRTTAALEQKDLAAAAASDEADVEDSAKRWQQHPDMDESTPRSTPRSGERRTSGGNIDNSGHRRGKKLKRDDDGNGNITKHMSDLIKILANEPFKRSENQAAFLELERMKHFESMSYRRESLRLGEQALMQSEVASVRLSSAIKDVSASLRFLATELAKKL